MAIVNDYAAIAKRLRELEKPANRPDEGIGPIEKWRDLAEETARIYVQNRRRSASLEAILRRRKARGAG